MRWLSHRLFCLFEYYPSPLRELGRVAVMLARGYPLRALPLLWRIESRMLRHAYERTYLRATSPAPGLKNGVAKTRR